MEEERRQETERQRALQQALAEAGPSPSPAASPVRRLSGMSLPRGSGYLDVSESTPRVGATPRGARRGLITSSQLDAYVSALRACNRSLERKAVSFRRLVSMSWGLGAWVAFRVSRLGAWR